MDEKLLLELVKQLCIRTGRAIDLIALKCGVNQDDVAKLYMETMKMILEGMEDING